MRKLNLMLLTLFLLISPLSYAQGQITVNWNVPQQTIDGFGASSAWTGDNLTTAQADLFFSQTTGIGLSFLRVRIPPDGTIESGATMQQAVARGARVWAVPISPPAYMKTNGSTTNGGSLLPSYYQPYADYLTSYVKNVKSQYGVDIYALSVQNEPDYVATYESCIWTGQNFHDFILNNLGPTFAANGLTTKIMLPEQMSWDFTLAETTLNDPTAAAYVGIVAAHGYSSSASAYPLAANLGKRLWETETSSFDAPDSSISNGLTWAKTISDWMTVAQANAWHYWWLISGNTDNEGLIQSDGTQTKRLYTLGNFSKFIRAGWTRVDVTNSTGLPVSAYQGSSGTAIVVVNNGSAVNQVITVGTSMGASVVPWITSATLSLAQQSPVTVSGGSFTYTIPANSAVTFVGSPSLPAPPAPTGLMVTVV